MRGRVGCLVGGLTGAVGGVVGAVVLVGLIASSLRFEGCEVDLSDVEDPGGSGRDSLRVPVEVAPTEELVDGTTVFVTSDAFAPHAIVAVAVCLAEAADDSRGVDACDTDGGRRFAVGPDGRLDAVVAVPRVITVAGEAHDCAATAERCILVAAATTDYDISGGEPLTFASDLPPAELTPRTRRPGTLFLPATLDPATPVAPGARITATVSGLMPGEPIIAGLCDDRFLLGEVAQACQPVTADAGQALLTRSVAEVDLHADETGRVTFTTTVPNRVEPLFGGGGTDCATEPGACALVVGAAADTQRSAYIPLTVTG